LYFLSCLWGFNRIILDLLEDYVTLDIPAITITRFDIIPDY